jgi:hypothetical protein
MFTQCLRKASRILLPTSPSGKVCLLAKSPSLKKEYYCSGAPVGKQRLQKKALRKTSLLPHAKDRGFQLMDVKKKKSNPKEKSQA